ncbi:MAG: rubredoxin [Desulfocucumaceae bacterium]
MKKWVCSVCGYVYDPQKENPPGESVGAARCGFTGDEAGPDDGFSCMQCGAGKEEFRIVVGGAVLMSDEGNKPHVARVTISRDDLEDEEEMKRAKLFNPPDPCGREEDRFGKQNSNG